MKPNLGGLDLKSTATALAGMVQVVGESSSFRPKGHRFDPWSGHMPRLWVQSPVGACLRGNQLMFLSHINIFSLFLSLCSSLSKSTKHILG